MSLSTLFPQIVIL